MREMLKLFVLTACLAALGRTRPAQSHVITPYSCSDGSWEGLQRLSVGLSTARLRRFDLMNELLTGDANFTKPTETNAVMYKKMSETFQKLAFDEFEFLRCG